MLYTLSTVSNMCYSGSLSCHPFPFNDYSMSALCIVLLKAEVSQDHVSLKKKKKKKTNNQPNHRQRKKKSHAGKGELKPLLHWAVCMRLGCSSGHASLCSLLILQKRGGKDHFAVQMLSNTSNQWKKWHNEQTSMWKQFMKK